MHSFDTYLHSSACFLDPSPYRKFHKLNPEDPELVLREVNVVATLMVTD